MKSIGSPGSEQPASGAVADPLTEILERVPRTPLAITPSPLSFLPRLSKHLGVNVYCKRDDLTGFGFGGNKVRKLEYLVHEAVARGADSLITCGSNQSNWCRMTAAVGAAVGMDVHLVLGGGKPESMTGNLRLDELLGAEMHFLDSGKDADLESASAALSERLRQQGKTPYHIIMGGSNGLGTFGYLRAFWEILGNERHLNVTFSHLLMATGSGGTQAGLVAGQCLSQWAGEIIGFTVSRSHADQERKVRRVLEQFDHVAGVETAGSVIRADDRYMGEGYRIPTQECRDAIRLFATTEGIFLDEVYSGKAAAGLIDYARSGVFKEGDSVLFLHSGGSAQLFE